MQLRMPEDASIEALIEQTKSTELGRLLLHGPGIAPASWEDDWSSAGSATTPRDDVISRVADLVSKSEIYNGRPALF